MQPLRRHVTFANVMSCLAVFIALATGGAYAANTVFSTDIVDGEVKARDVAPETLGSGQILNNSLRAADIAPDGVGASELGPDVVSGAKVAPNSLGGADIDESALGKVPGAAEADSVGRSSAAELETSTDRSIDFECDPTSSSFIPCSESPVGVTLNALSDVVVTATGSWYGTSDDADSGMCQIVVDDELGGGLYPYGQRGNVHDAAARGAPIAQTSSFPNLPAGPHDIWLQCRETNADFFVAFVELTVLRLGGQDPLDPQ